MRDRYTVITYTCVFSGNILCDDDFELKPAFADKPAAWPEAGRRARAFPDEATIVYGPADAGAIWCNFPKLLAA